MPNRTLALDVGGPAFRAAVAESTLRTQRVLGVYASPRTPGADLGVDLRGFLTRHALQWDEVVSALPGNLVTHRVLRLPFRDRRRLDQTVAFELESHLPFDIEQAVVDYQVISQSDGEAVILAVLAPKSTVREHLETLAAAGLDPRVVDLAPLAPLNLLRLGQVTGTGLAAFLGVDPDRTTVALLRDGALVGLRTLSRGIASPEHTEPVVRDIRWSLLALADTSTLESLTVWIGGESAGVPGLSAALERALGTTPRSLDTLPLDAVPPTLRREQARFATPLGLAVRERVSDRASGVDFRRGEFAYHREREALWNGLLRGGVLALVAAALALTSVLLESRQLQTRRDAVRSEIRSVFTAALPDTRTIVNEKAQLATEIANLEKQSKTHGRIAPSAPRTVDVLRALSEGVPSDVSLDIDELSLDDETLRIRGSTRAYEMVEAVKRGLAARPEFLDVQVKDVRSSVDGQRVDFRLSMTVASDTSP